MKYTKAIRQYTIILIQFALVSIVNAQNENKINCLTLVKRDSIVIRWAPSSLPVWQSGISNGYVIKRYTIAKNGVFIPDGLNNGVILTPTPVRPLAEELFESIINNDQRAAIVQDAIFNTRSFIRTEADNFSAYMKTYEEEETRFGFALFICDISPEIANAAGLRFTDVNLTEGERYAYSISLVSIPDGLQVDPGVVVADVGDINILPEVTEISSVFLNKAVKFRWRIDFHKGIYSAYILEKSFDNKTYNSVTSLPLVNLTESDDQEFFFYTDSLENNNVQVWYRIKGISPFGETGPPSKVITGKGVSDFLAYASIDTAVVTENKTITLRWRLSEIISSPVRKIDILRSDNHNGQFQKINKNPLNPKVRTFIDENPGQTNYYKVKLTGNEDLVSYSFPYFVEIEDNTPPQPPEQLSGKIDSLGIVTIIWSNNPEPDLFGYKVFRANSPVEEFIPLKKGIVNENIYYDTINLNTLTPTVCYQVVAIDRNYNSSEYSKILELTRPDTIPPSPGIISMLSDENGKVKIWMEESPSRDVNYYELKRQLEVDSTSLSISILKVFKEIYEDIPSYEDKEYTYHLITYDKSQNKSENSRKIFVKSTTIDQVALEIIQSPDGKNIKLSWEIPQNFIPAKIIIYKSKNDEQLKTYSSPSRAERIYVDNDIEINTSYNYRLLVYEEKGFRIAASKVVKFKPYK
jgi:hypothetical protein